MTQQHLNVGTTANDGTGDLLRSAFQKVEANFNDLYGIVGSVGNPLTIGGATVRTGSGTPTASDATGSIYMQTDSGGLWARYPTSGSLPARVQEKTAAGTLTATLTSTPTVGNYLIAFCADSPIPAVASGWTTVSTHIGTANILVCYRQVQTGDTTTVTPATNSPTSSATIAVIEVSGIGASWAAAFDQCQFADNTGVGNATYTLTRVTPATNCLAVACGQFYPAAVVLSINSGWTNTSNATNGTGVVILGSQSLSSSGTTVTETVTADHAWYGLSGTLLTLKPATGLPLGWQRVSGLTVIKATGTTITSDVRSVNYSTGLTASDDGSGNTTISFATIANNNLLANTSGSTGTPVATTLTTLIDSAIGSTRGSILYRGASGWSVLTPGTSTFVLTSNGAGADPSWAAASGGGGGASVTISTTAPSTPSSGNLWWKSDDGIMLIYYNDGTSSQWVRVDPVAASTPAMTLLQSQTASASSGLIFSNINTSLYNNFELIYTNVIPGTSGATIGLQFSIDNGSTFLTGSSYTSGWRLNGVTTSFEQYTGASTTTYASICPGGSTTNPSQGRCILFDANTSAKKMIKTDAIIAASDGNMYNMTGSHVYTTATTFNAIKILAGVGTFSGTFKLYGIA